MRILGVDIGGTNIDVVLFDGSHYRHVGNYPTSTHFENLIELLERLVVDIEVDAVGVGAAVWLKKGEQVLAPNLPSLVNLKGEIAGIPVFLDNDANCFAIFAHASFGFPNILAITIGTGIGSGIIANGKIYRGDGMAGEIGHWIVGGSEECACGGKGHLECYFGGWSLKKKYGKEAKELMKDEGFIYSIEGFDLFCRSVANAVMLLDPTAVVLGGRIGMQLDEAKLKERIYRYLMPGFTPEIKILKDELAVAKGACLLARGQLEG